MNGDVARSDAFDEREGECAAYVAELTRVAYGELGLDAASAALQGHVRSCCACAELLRDAALLVPAMRDALHPAPLSPLAVARVESALAPARSAPRSLRLPSWRLPLAAAAAIALLVVWRSGAPDADPGSSAESDGRQVADVSLSADDAADLAAAFGLVQWADVLELSVASADSHVDNLEQSLDRQADAQTLLPWSADDDWDLPPPTAGTQHEHPAAANTLVSSGTIPNEPIRLPEPRRS